MAVCDKQHGLTDESYEIERINAAFGTPADRWFRVEWQDHPGKDSWEPERSLVRQGCEEAIKECVLDGLKSAPTSFQTLRGCDCVSYTCGRGYKSVRTLKAHITRTHTKRYYHGTATDKDIRLRKRKEQQTQKCCITCEGEKIGNEWIFKYLCSRFRADGDQLCDIKARIVTVTVTEGKMRGIWASKSIPTSLKMRIYKTGVCSKMTYGSETWNLNDRACTILNGANARMVSHITHKTVHEEACSETRTFDLM